MRVTNPHDVPYSLLQADNTYRVAEAGKSYDDMDIHPSAIDEYKLKGFGIEAEAAKEGAKSDASDKKQSDNNASPNPASGAKK